MIRIALLIAVVGAVTPAFACSCLPSDPKRTAARVEMLFEGRVTERRGGVDLAGKPATLIRIRVTRMVKGHRPPSGVVTLFSATHPMACGVDYDEGFTGRFGASMHTGGLYTNSCLQHDLNLGAIGR